MNLIHRPLLVYYIINLLLFKIILNKFLKKNKLYNKDYI